MQEQEGVIKYRLDHIYQTNGYDESLSEMNAWRTIFFRLDMIGQNPLKYGGLGFGNISRKPKADDDRFIISGTQTGHIEHLTDAHYCTVIDVDFVDNAIRSRGACKPSSEALTHACVYRQDARIRAVIHVHSPELWRKTAALKLPHTAADIAYGTPAMVQAVEELFKTGQFERLHLFSMLGHEDGVVSFGHSMQQAAWELIRHLALAIGIERR